MTPAEYLSLLKERLLADPLVIQFGLVRERATSADAYLRARVILKDHSQLEFSEYVQATPEETIVVVTYSYHWSDTQGELICRWDNTPHFPDLPNAPHHLHMGQAEAPQASSPMSLFAVLDEIARRLSEGIS